MTFNERLDSFPPILVRLLAAKKHGPTGRSSLTTKEIADAGGLLIPVVTQVAHMKRWDDMTVSTMRKFQIGCGLDFSDPHQMRRLDDYMQSTPTLGYLRRSPFWTSEHLPMLVEWASSHNSDTIKLVCEPVQELWKRISRAISGQSPKS